MRARLKSGATDVGLRLLGVKEDLEASADACKQLFDQARYFKQIVTDYNGPHDAQALSTLHGVLDNIFKFEKELGEENLLAELRTAQQRQQRLDLYKSQLLDAWTRYHADITVRQQRPTEVQVSGPIPIDQLSAILPAYLSTYVGHGDELKALVTLILNNPSARAVILGGGGMGKTAMATKAMYDASIESKFDNRRFFISCDGVISAEGIVTALASVFSVTESQGTTKEQALLNYLRTLRLSVLIVLDNLESAWDTDDQNNVETFLSNLCHIDLLAVVVTMRGTSPPHGPLWHQTLALQPLDRDDAQDLFKQLCSQSADRDDVYSLAELLNELEGLPLGITLLASLGRTGYSPAQLLAAYREERTAMVKKAGRVKDRLSNLDISMGVSINCQTMQEHPEALQLLSLLALLPDGLPEADRTAVLPTMTHYPSAERILVQVALCSQTNGVCRVLAPIRAYVEMHHPPVGPYVKELHQYHFRLALRGWGWESAAVRKEVGSNMRNIQAVLLHAMTRTDNAADVLQSLLALSDFSSITIMGDCVPYLQAAISTYQGPAKASENSPSEMKWYLAKLRIQLGKILSQRSDYNGARAALEAARMAFEDIGDTLGAAHCIETLGGILIMQNEYPGAALAFKEARGVFEELGDRLGTAQCIQQLGDILLLQSDYDGATSALNEALGAFDEMGYRLGAAQCTRSLGVILLIQGDYGGATAAFEELKGVFDEIGDRLGSTQCIQALGEILMSLGDYSGATGALEEARVVSEAIGDRLGTAQCIQRQGEISSFRGDYNGAIAAVKAAKGIFEEIGHRLGTARCTGILGDILRLQGDYDGATTALTEAKGVMEDIGDRHRAAWYMQRLGYTLGMRGDYDGAIGVLKEAMSVFQATGDRQSESECAEWLEDCILEATLSARQIY